MKKICEICELEFETLPNGGSRKYCFTCSPPYPKGGSRAGTIAAMRKAMKKAAVPVAVTVGANLIIKFICGLIANKLYYKKIIDDMKLINDSVREENLRRMMIARRGGVSVFGFAISLTGYNVVIELLASAANAISNMF